MFAFVVSEFLQTGIGRLTCDLDPLSLSRLFHLLRFLFRHSFLSTGRTELQIYEIFILSSILALLFPHPWISTLKNYHSIVINVMKFGMVNKLQQLWTDSSYFTAWFYAFSHNYTWKNIVKQKSKKIKGSGKWKITSIFIVHQFHISYFTWNFAWFPPGLNCSTFPGWPKCATIRRIIHVPPHLTRASIY